jgi:aconitate hydratase
MRRRPANGVANALCGAVYKTDLRKTKSWNIAGPGIQVLPMDYRLGIDVMTTKPRASARVWPPT